MSHKIKLGKPDKVLVGLATVWVAIYPLLFLYGFWLGLSQLSFFAPVKPLEGFSLFIYSFVFSIPVVYVTIILYLVLIVLYLSHLHRITTAPVIARVMFGISIIFLPFIAMPAYYLVFILLPDRRGIKDIRCTSR